LKGVFNPSWLERYFSDLKATWPVILAAAGIAFIVGGFYMVIMRYGSGLFTWLAILFYFILLILLAAFFYSRGREKEDLAKKE